MKYKILYFLLSLFYLGKIKYAPGTVASAFTVIIWYMMDFSKNSQIIIIVSILIVGLILCYCYSKYNGNKDPSFIVVDEFVGMSIALLMVPKISYLYLLSFLLFRVFDIFKPGLISNSEKIGNGIGIMLDDIMSGIITLCIVHLFINWI